MEITVEMRTRLSMHRVRWNRRIVPARMERLTTTEALDRAPAAAPRPVIPYALGRVRGTTRVEPAACAERAEHRRQQPPVDGNRGQEHCRDERAQNLRHSFSISRTTWS